MKERIVVIVEKEAQGQALRDHLGRGGYEVIVLPLSAKVHLRLSLLNPQLVVYACNQPEGPSLTALRNVRAAVPAPLLVLGPDHSEAFVVNTLKGGADDCLCEPYSVSELLARVEALLRRRRQWQRTDRGVEQTLLIDDLTHSVVADGREIKLTPTEHRLLRYLLGRSGVATHEELSECIWGHFAGAKRRRLGSHIRSLRKKLERDPRHPQRILTKRGVGYYLSWVLPDESLAQS